MTPGGADCRPAAFLFGRVSATYSPICSPRARASRAAVTAEWALRIASTLADGASLELPLGLPVLDSVTIEMRLAERPAVVKEEGIR